MVIRTDFLEEATSTLRLEFPQEKSDENNVQVGGVPSEEGRESTGLSRDSSGQEQGGQKARSK